MVPCGRVTMCDLRVHQAVVFTPKARRYFGQHVPDGCHVISQILPIPDSQNPGHIKIAVALENGKFYEPQLLMPAH